MFLSELFVKFEVIDHFFNTMHTKIVKSNSLWEWRPFEIEKCIGTRYLNPITISFFKTSFDQIRVISSYYDKFVGFILSF